MRYYLLFIPLIVAMIATAGCKAEKEPPTPYQQYQYNEKHFGKDLYSEILYEGTEEERNAVISVMETAEEILSYIGPQVDRKEAESTVGALAMYYPYKDILKAEYSLELVSVKLEGQTGVMWVLYSHRAYDSDGLAFACGKGLARWELEQIDGDWIVTDRDEAP